MITSAANPTSTTTARTNHASTNQENAMTSMNPATNLTITTPASTSSFGSTLARSLRCDAISMTTIRSNKIVAGIAALASAGIAAALTLWEPEDGASVLMADVLNGGFMLTALLCTVLGVLAFTTDAQHGSLVAQLTAQPSRMALGAARLVSVASMGAIVASLAAAGAIVATIATGSDVSAVIDSLGAVGAPIAVCASCAVFGLGVGMLIRHSAIAITAVLAWWLVIENILMAVLDADVSRYLPFQAALGAVMDFSDDAISGGTAVLVFAGYALAIFLVGLAVFSRRDVA